MPNQKKKMSAPQPLDWKKLWKMDTSREGPLTKSQLEQFWEDGFLLVKDVIDVKKLTPVEEELAGSVDEVANRLYNAGKIQNLHTDKGFLERLTALENDWPGASVLVHIKGVMGPELSKLYESPELINIALQVLGPNIAAHPVWNVRSKTPKNPLATVPWHQDIAYLTEGAEKTMQLTAWIPLIDATLEMGCMSVLRGGHREGRICPHQPESTRTNPTSHSPTAGDSRSWYLYIKDEDLPKGEKVLCEVPKGSILLLNNMIPHCSSENYSNKIRWSLDLRWQRPDESTGFEGMKESLLIRTEKDPNYRPDWSSWNVSRTELQSTKAIKDPFNTTVAGFWLERWKVAESK